MHKTKIPYAIFGALLAVCFAIGTPSASAQTNFLTWQGTGNNWNNSTRWNGWGTNTSLPYGQLQWTGGGDALGTNNITSLNQWRMFFNGNTAYTLRGNAVRLFDLDGGNGGIMNRASAAQTIEMDISFRDAGARYMFIVNRMGGSGTGGGGGALNLNNISITGGVTTVNISGEAGTGAINILGTISGVDKSLTIGRDHANNVQTGTLLNLHGNNTFSGGMIFRSGILRAGNNAALGTGKLSIDPEGSSERVLASLDGAARSLANNIDLFNNLTLGQASGGTGSLDLTGNVFLGDSAGTRAITVNGSHRISGIISGVGRGLDKLGAGVLRLSGNNTFGGPINVAAGELQIDGNQAGSSGTVTVSSNATLSGSGTIGGATTISGVHNPGSSPGIQTFTSNLTYNSGSVINWELTANTAASGARGTSYDGIDLVGAANLNFAGPTTINLIFNQASTVSWADTFWDNNRSWLVYDLNDGLAQNFNNLAINTLNWADSLSLNFQTARPDASFSLAQTGEDILLVYTVPEPSTWALLALGAGLLAIRLRSRQR